MEINVKTDFWELFPEAKIGLLIVKGVTNQYNDTEKYAQLLEEAQKKCLRHLPQEDFAENTIIKRWRSAFQKFKIKKGVRSSIEALLKRVQNGKSIGTINPLVDIYNSVSLEYAVPCGGEDIDKIQGAMLLTLANGDEPFITLGSEESEPPYAGELVYKDDAGAICRCWNWRESVRTMLTEHTRNAVFVIEATDNDNATDFQQALISLKQRIAEYLGGSSEIIILTKENPNYIEK